jgi:hypothetical protein
MHAGLMGAFALAETPELANIVYLENADDGQTIEDPQMGSKMALQFDALRTEALTGRASIATIEKAADQWREE